MSLSPIFYISDLIMEILVALPFMLCMNLTSLSILFASDVNHVSPHLSSYSNSVFKCDVCFIVNHGVATIGFPSAFFKLVLKKDHCLIYVVGVTNPVFGF